MADPLPQKRPHERFGGVGRRPLFVAGDGARRQRRERRLALATRPEARGGRGGTALAGGERREVADGHCERGAVEAGWKLGRRALRNVLEGRALEGIRSPRSFGAADGPHSFGVGSFGAAERRAR